MSILEEEFMSGDLASRC